MKKTTFCAALLVSVAAGAAGAAGAAESNPDESFYENAAQGGMAEVEMGQLAADKGTNPSVKEFGAMMVKDHSAANKKLAALAARKMVKLPSGPSLGEKATKTKLDMMSGDTFDKSYIKGMIKDHQDDIELFQKEASSGQDAEAKAFAMATLPTLKMHLSKIQSIATKAGVSAD